MKCLGGKGGARRDVKKRAVEGGGREEWGGGVREGGAMATCVPRLFLPYLPFCLHNSGARGGLTPPPTLSLSLFLLVNTAPPAPLPPPPSPSASLTDRQTDG
jgi:hypothetical protein